MLEAGDLIMDQPMKYLLRAWKEDFTKDNGASGLDYLDLLY